MPFSTQAYTKGNMVKCLSVLPVECKCLKISGFFSNLFLYD